MDGALERIEAEVGSWEGVEMGEGRFGSTVFRLGRRELGHVHGDGLADLPLPHAVHDELIASGRAEEHRFTPPGSGWVSMPMRSDEDVEGVIELLRGQYERALSKAHQH